MKKYNISHDLPLSVELGGTFRELHFCMYNKLNQQLKAIDLTIEQMRLLKIVCDNPGCDQNFLAANTEKGKSAVTRIINTMIDNDLLKREQSGVDARSNLVFPTEHGAGLVVQGLEILRNFSNELFGSDQEELKQLLTMANDLIRRLKA
ncbi:MarR family transcriptional regulator [Prolixibacteraceae bacterium JC049]|nr:MarR family transcriptional regulator [Prolixibacteraceae bacterium JC049]